MPTVNASELELQGVTDLTELEAADYSQGLQEPDRYPSLLVTGIRTTQELDFFTSLSSPEEETSVLLYINEGSEVFPVGYFNMVLGQLLKLKFMNYGLTLYLEDGSFPLETPEDFLSFAQLGNPVSTDELMSTTVQEEEEDDLLTVSTGGYSAVVDVRTLDDILL